MKELIHKLESIGFTKTEATLYLTGLKHSGSNATSLSERTGIKRPTVYSALNSLEQKGAAQKRRSGVGNVFVMTPPSQLKSVLEQEIRTVRQQHEDFLQLLPDLESLAGNTAESNSVTHYDGIDGVKTAIDNALYCQSRTWQIIAPSKNFFSEFDQEYAEYYSRTRQERGITSQSLWEKTAAGEMRTPGGHRLSQRQLEERSPRFLPHGTLGDSQSMLIMFDDSLLIISSHDSTSAVLISSQETSAFMRGLFKTLWNVSETP